MTERDIQHAIYDYRVEISASPIILPNVYIWHWESDLLYLSRNDHATEFEIKRTHSDFLAEAKKQSKCRSLKNGLGPTEFYFVCPEGVIGLEELPEYAGLFYVKPRTGQTYWKTLSDYQAWRIKRAKRRPTQKLTKQQKALLLLKGVSRYWSAQYKIVDKEAEDAGQV